MRNYYLVDIETLLNYYDIKENSILSIKNNGVYNIIQFTSELNKFGICNLFTVEAQRDNEIINFINNELQKKSLKISIFHFEVNEDENGIQRFNQNQFNFTELPAKILAISNLYQTALRIVGIYCIGLNPPNMPFHASIYGLCIYNINTLKKFAFLNKCKENEEILLWGNEDYPFIVVNCDIPTVIIEGRMCCYDDISYPFEKLKTWTLNLFQEFDKLNAHFRIEFMNEVSFKEIKQFILLLNEFAKKKHISLYWYFPDDDKDMLSDGEFFRKIFCSDFIMVEYCINTNIEFHPLNSFYRSM